MKKLLLLCLLTMMFTGLYSYDITIKNKTERDVTASLSGEGMDEPLTVTISSKGTYIMPDIPHGKLVDIKLTYPDGNNGEITAGDVTIRKKTYTNNFLIKKDGNTYNWDRNN